MINFTVGPVQLDEVVRKMGSEDIPYFRTPEFSEVMLQNENLIKKFAKAEESARAVFITGSGTAAMEATIMNVFNKNDRVLIVNGGSFGQRFVEICKIHNIEFTEIKLKVGEKLEHKMLQAFSGKGYTGFIVNIHETSTGVHYDLEIISRFCKENNLFLVVDAISSFLADSFDMKSSKVDIMITGSQKALACPPGVSIIVLSNAAIKRVNENEVRSMYFDLKSALKDGERGQTPFTPAVGILLQINARLKQIDDNGGVESEEKKSYLLATDFRNRIKELPLDICSESLSNAVTPLATRNCSAYDIFTILKDQYNIWVCPNGGALKNKVFRVGHIGNLSVKENIKLVDALQDLVKRNILR